MKRAKNKYTKGSEKYKSLIKEHNHDKNHTEQLEMNLSHPIKINKKHFKKKINILESSSTIKNKLSISPKHSNNSKDKIFTKNFMNSDNKNYNNSLKYSIKNNNNSSSDNIKYLVKEDNSKQRKNKEIKPEQNILENNDDFNIINTDNKLKDNVISSSIKNENNSSNDNPINNLNQIYTYEEYNNDLFSNLFIDTSFDNKNILVSELDIELSNMDQSNCNKKNDKIDNNQNMNIIEDEEDTNQKSNEHIDIYKKIELRFKSKLEKSLNKYFKKNGTNFYIGDNNNNQINNDIKCKSNKNVQNVLENKKDIKNLINSDGKILNNINFTIDLRENDNNNKHINNNSKLGIFKNKLKENGNIKKFQKIISFKSKKFTINNNKENNNKLINRKNTKKIVKKDCSTKNRIIKQNKNSPIKTNTIVGEKKIKAIYSNIINDANLINKNKNKILKENEIYLNKNNVNKKNNSTGIRDSFKNSTYYLHSINSINSIKTKKNFIISNNNKYNQLYLHKMNNNKFKGKISITSSYNTTKRKNLDDIKNNKNNITYLNSKSVKNKNKLNKFFSFAINDYKNHDNYDTQRSKNKKINYNDLKNRKKKINKKEFKSYNYKMRGNPLNNYKSLNTEINNFNIINYFNCNNRINNKIELSNRKTKNKNKELINNKNFKNNKIKTNLYDEDNSENSIFFYKNAFFMYCSPYKNCKIMQHNSFKKNVDNNL